jgi:hypothetical protein
MYPVQLTAGGAEITLVREVRAGGAGAFSGPAALDPPPTPSVQRGIVIRQPLDSSRGHPAGDRVTRVAASYFCGVSSRFHRRATDGNLRHFVNSHANRALLHVKLHELVSEIRNGQVPIAVLTT